MATTGSTPEAGQTEQSRRAQRVLVQLVLRGMAIALVATLISYAYLLFFDQPNWAATRMQQVAADAAEQQAELVDQLVTRWQFRLLSLARDPALITRLSDHPEAAAAIERQLQRAFPEVTSLRLIPLGPLGIAALRPEGTGLRNNIEIDMLRRAATDAPPAPESYGSKEGQIISFAQAIVAPGGDHATAALLLSIPAGQIGQLLETAVGSRGEARLIQTVGQEAIAIVAVGKGNRNDLAQIAHLSVPNWQLQFTPADDWLGLLRPPTLVPWVAFAVTVTGILLGSLLVATALRRALRRNLDSLLGRGEPDLPGFAEAREQLLRKPSAVATGSSNRPDAEQSAPTTATSTAVSADAPAVAPEVAAPAPPFSTAATVQAQPADRLPDAIFRAYDIRGAADAQLTDAVVRLLGLAIGSEAVERGQQQLVLARDGRTSSARIAQILASALQETGRDVVDVGEVPTPVLNFAIHHLDARSGVMVTGSHNPAEDNGLKIVMGGRPLAGAAIQALKSRIAQGDFVRGRGSYRTDRVDDAYIDYIANDVAIAQPLKVVVDAGNGVTGHIAPRLLEALGCEVVPLFCDVDGRFPNHHPDPTVASNLRELQRVVVEEGADLGVAFDGDGDRIGAVTSSGQVVAADRLLMLLAQDVVARNPGADVLFDVKCSRLLNTVVSSFGGRPILWKSGHAFMRDKMAETGALVGGEFSGHIYFNERWFGFDDGMYAAARLIEILSTSDPDLDRQLAAFPALVNTPELKIPVDDVRKFEIVEQLVERGRFGEGKATTLDGLRIDFADGWGLVRASNTSPALTLRFEADTEEALQRIQTLFKEQLSAIDPALTYGF